MARKRNSHGKEKGIRMKNEIIRLHEIGIGTRKIAKVLEISRNTVKKYVQVEQDQIIPHQIESVYEPDWAKSINWSMVEEETNRGVKLYHYWEENIDENPSLASISYISFWRHYKRLYPDIPLHLHKIHPPGERCEVDYKGRGDDCIGLEYHDLTTGEFVPCKLFGSILCFSQLFYARATRTEKQSDFFESIARGYEYFGGVPCTTAIDNTKAAVIKADRYDPDLNPEFSLFCEFYGTAPLAMRPWKPKDKNLIENALGVFWRWVGPKIKKRQFFSLGEINAFIEECCDKYNSRIQKKYGISRQQKFDNSERDKLLPLPVKGYSWGIWKKAKVHPDCHIQVQRNFYSVPYSLRGQEVDVRIGGSAVEVYVNLQRVAMHLLASERRVGVYITKKEHLPDAHIAIKEFTPQKAISEGETIGDATGEIIRNLISKSTHPLMYLRRCQGILRLAKRYSASSLEAACKTLVSLGSSMPKLSDVEGVITHENAQRSLSNVEVKRASNPNLRGQESFSPLEIINSNQKEEDTWKH